jgi:hemolysin activation/secretion protein
MKIRLKTSLFKAFQAIWVSADSAPMKARTPEGFASFPITTNRSEKWTGPPRGRLNIAAQPGRQIGSLMSQNSPCFSHPKKVRASFLAALFLLGFSSPALHAQSSNEQSLTTDGGAIRNQIERNLPPPALPEVTPKPAPKVPKASEESGEKIVVSRFRFVGNTLLSDRALTRSVELYVNRPVDFNELQNAAAMAALAYRDKGYVATVSIPRQEIEGGVVTLKVVESKYAGASIDGSSSGRINSELILARVEKAMSLEPAVNVNVLDRAMLLINDLPGASVQAGLAAGANEGETAVVLQSAYKPVLTGALNIDSYGALTTGPERMLFDAALNSPAGRGEQYTMGLLATEGVRYGRLGVSVPVGLYGTRLGINSSHMNYTVIGGSAVASNIYGNSTTVGIDVSYPVVRSQQANLFLTGGTTGKIFENYAGPMLTRSSESLTATVAVNGNWVDRVFNGASNQASLSLTTGNLHIRDETSRLSDASAAATEGGFSKINAAITRNQAVRDGVSLVLSLTGQLASKNLDSSEKLFLGGPSGVRGYPVSEGGGSQGHLGTVELRMQLPRKFELRLFYDSGRVKQNVNDYASMPSPNWLNYHSQGASLLWQAPRNITFTATLAQRIGENPYPDIVTGNDQDGTKKFSRLWLSASMPF